MKWVQFSDDFILQFIRTDEIKGQSHWLLLFSHRWRITHTLAQCVCVCLSAVIKLERCMVKIRRNPIRRCRSTNLNSVLFCVCHHHPATLVLFVRKLVVVVVYWCCVCVHACVRISVRMVSTYVCACAVCYTWHDVNACGWPICVVHICFNRSTAYCHYNLAWTHRNGKEIESDQSTAEQNAYTCKHIATATEK